VWTLTGHTRHDKVSPSERIQDVTVEFVRFFVARRELTEGDYALTLPVSVTPSSTRPAPSPSSGWSATTCWC
jgi:hypothetical protein